MKIFSISKASALLAAFAYAAPPSALDTGQFQVSVTFFGAGGAQYTQNFPADNSVVKISTFFFFFYFLFFLKPNPAYVINQTGIH